MFSLQTASSSENKGLLGSSSKSNKKEESSGGDFLATLLKTIKKEDSSITTSQNTSQNDQNIHQSSTSSVQNDSTQKSKADSSYENVANNENVASNEERLNIDENAIAAQEQKSATLEGVASTDESAQSSMQEQAENAANKIIEWVDGKPVIKDSPIIQILSALEIANGGDKNSIPTLSKSLEKLISIEANLSELKNVKDLKELIKIAEKLELNLGKISISGSDIKAIKSTFPKLAQMEFFKPVEVALNKAVAQNKAPSIQNTNVSLASLLKADLPRPTTISSAIASAAIASKQDDKSPIKAVPNSLQSILNDDKIKNAPKNTDPKAVETKPEIKPETKPEIKPNEVKIDPKTDNIKAAKDAPKIAVNEAPKDVLKDLLKDAVSKKESEIKDTKEQISDIKPNAAILGKEALKEDPNKAFDISNYLNTISKKAASAIEETRISDISTQNQPKDASQESENNLKFEPGVENRMSENNIKDMINAIKMQDRIIAKDVQINSIRTFASEMVEKISEFKPPVTRINMQLHPAELGEVNVTMIARANNLHVNITSTNNTMALFLQNQAEFKANLVNMGFSGIEMSFGDNKEGSQNANQQNGKKARAAYEEDENMINEIENTNGETSLEIVLPRYI